MIETFGFVLAAVVVIGWCAVLVAATRSDLKQWREYRRQQRERRG